MKRLNGILLLAFGLITLSSGAQFAPQQSQYMYNQIAVNPGATGKDNALNITMSYRTMWQGIEGAPRTMYFNVHTPMKKETISLGLQIFSDQIGVSKRNGIMLSGAYRIKLYKSELAFGLGVGALASQDNWQEIQTVEQNDRVFTQGNMNHWLPATAVGVYYNSKTMFAGVSVPQMFSEVYAGGNSYKTSFNPKNYSIQLIAGRWFKISKHHKVLASLLARYHKSGNLQSELSAIYSYNNLFDIGFSYRLKDAAVLTTRFKINGQFSLAYSYDYSVNGLAAYNKGTHEISLFYTFLFKSNSPNAKSF